MVSRNQVTTLWPHPASVAGLTGWAVRTLSTIFPASYDALAETTSARGSLATAVVPPLASTRLVASPTGSVIAWLLAACALCPTTP